MTSALVALSVTESTQLPSASRNEPPRAKFWLPLARALMTTVPAEKSRRQP